jgi:uncharacterized protein YggT (Ycf19 family)
VQIKEKKMGFIGLFLMPLLDILGFAADLYFKVVVVDIALYWLLHYKLITVHNKYAEKFMEILKKITEPVYSVIRSKIPPVADYDIAPYILLLLIAFVCRFITYLNQWIGQFM